MTDQINKLGAKYGVTVPKALTNKDNIAVIEDQTDMRLIIAHHLQKMNFSTVKQWANGYDAIDGLKTEEQKYAAYICDMEMPVMGGLDMLEELRENPALDRGPFVLTMDNVSKEKIMLAVENGVDEILVKPFTLGDIAPKLRTAFAKFHNPANPEKLYELAKQKMRNNEPAEAEKIYKDLAVFAPKAARPVVGLARLARQRNDLELAMKLLENAEAKNPNYVHLYQERAMIFAARSEWESAIAQFMKAIDLSPLNPMRYKEASDLLFKVKKYREAADMLEGALNRNIVFPDLYHFLSQAKFALKDFPAAQKYIKSALQSDPENVNYLNQLGICQKELKLFDDANKTYNQIIKNDPNNTHALYNKAMMLLVKGETAEAIKHLERALKKNPEFREAAAKLSELRKGAA